MNKASHRFTASLLLLLFASLALPSYAAIMVPASPKIKARGFLLMDFDSGRILTEKKSGQRMEPASLTKMLTSYVIANELANGGISLDEMVTISKKAWRMQGSRMFIEVGKKVSVEDLLKGIIIQSGNDATVALAEHVAGSEETFADLMNQHAAELGMLDSHFVNSTGLPKKNHYTTPGDMAKLARALIKNFPEHYEWYSTKEFKFNKIKQYNRNKLLWRNKFVDGIKTGHTDSAGYCLVASAKRDGMRLISVVLGTRSEEARAAESQKLLSYGFRFFETHKLYAANEPLTQTHIWKGAVENLSLGLEENLYITIPKGQYKKLDADMNITARITAPVKKGASFGTVNVRLGDKQYATRNLIALTNVEKGGLVDSLIDEIKLLFE
ncbi:MAG: D-alanyl-D-alanine carboxypeptidase [Gammaproteobacteria bacterium]|nr:D-alanyl-D-alanine carboxypeptidase [Gammaproteobacteria bacterium]